MRILPALENTGIVFIRTDLVNGARTIPALWDNVVDTRMCSVLGNDEGGRVGTVEHLMAALSAFSIDNAIIEIDGPEVPVMDGSSDPFVFLIEMAGTVAQSAGRRMIQILSPIEVKSGDKYARFTPAPDAIFACDIAFDNAAISQQSYSMALSADNFKREVSRARTFGFFEEVEQMQKMGLARGGSLDNAIVIKGDQVMNEGGLRYSNEFVRHKLLDAVGDIALAGMPILGRFDAHCPGHALNNQLLRALFANPSAWRIVNAT
jgi:UDP-3-O-[3-hydroxymyristoyl] N-acetylglucosamine deacetylase